MITSDPDAAHLDEAGTLRFERDLPGPIGRVWDYLTKRELAATWFGEGWEIPHLAGQPWRHAADMHGVVRVYDPPHVLELTWNDDHTDGAEIVEAILRIELREAGERVRLTLTHRALPFGAMLSKGPGWHAYLDALRARLQGEMIDPMVRYRERQPEYERRLRERFAQH